MIEVQHKLWLSLKHEDIRLPISDFLWKMMHGALRCGNFWAKISGLEERVQCPHCETIETQEHILVKCKAAGQREIWKLAAELWNKTDFKWPSMSHTEALTFGMRRWRRKGSKEEEQSANRLWRILISESIHLIWKLRCERKIQHEGEVGWTHHASAIQSRWMYALNSRLLLDREMARPRRAHRPIPADLVLNTWVSTLKDKDSLPKDWQKKPWVLVGIATPLALTGPGG